MCLWFQVISWLLCKVFCNAHNSAVSSSWLSHFHYQRSRSVLVAVVPLPRDRQLHADHQLRMDSPPPGSLSCRSYCLNFIFIFGLRDAILSKKCSFFEHCSKGLWSPPPFIWTFVLFCRGCFLKRVFEHLIMYLFHPQISPSMPQKSLFMQISCC